MGTVTLYGLKTCDTCRKAMKWFETEGIGARLVDVRKEPLSLAQLNAFVDAAGADRLINRRGTTWRGLSDADKARAEGGAVADLLAQYPALMKRPVIEAAGSIHVGFSDEVNALIRTLTV